MKQALEVRIHVAVVEVGRRVGDVILCFLRKHGVCALREEFAGWSAELFQGVRVLTVCWGLREGLSGGSSGEGELLFCSLVAGLWCLRRREDLVLF